MNLLTVRNLSKSFGGHEIFSGVTFNVDEGDRVALVGPNGRGKTTLMRILAGELSADGGVVQWRRGIRVTYLPQELMDVGHTTPMQLVMSGVAEVRKLEDELSHLEHMNPDSPEEMERQAHRIAEIHEQLAQIQDEFSAARARSILSGLGFGSEDMSRPLSEMSGGWRMRAVLASQLFLAPDIMLLDEPTNHLDIPSLNWLDSWLTDFRGAFIVISHDRDFLDRHVRRVFALESEGFRTYRGNYSQSRKMRAEEVEILENRRRNMEQERRQLERFVERFRAKATKARQVKSVIKRLERMDDVDLLKSSGSISFSFPEVQRSGDRVVEIRDLSMSFGERSVISGLCATVMRGERIGIVGPNGCGKTTLLRILAGRLTPSSGTVRMGANVSVRYYAQHQIDDLDPRSTILEEVRRLAPSMPESRLRGILGAFLFSGDDTEKAIGVLSGGEKSRVALAKLLVDPGNLLLLDEPTNHLDLDSSEALAHSLSTFGGTIIFVSHNRAFLRKLATRIWDLSGGTLYEYPGTWDEYEYHVARQSTVQDIRKEQDSGGGERSRVSKQELRRRNAQIKELERSFFGEHRRRIDALEKEIASLEEELEALKKQTWDPEFYRRPDVKEHMLAMSDMERRIEGLYDELAMEEDAMEEKRGRYEKALAELKASWDG